MSSSKFKVHLTCLFAKDINCFQGYLHVVTDIRSFFFGDIRKGLVAHKKHW
jgi:hypothetical protein